MATSDNSLGYLDAKIQDILTTLNVQTIEQAHEKLNLIERGNNATNQTEN